MAKEVVKAQAGEVAIPDDLRAQMEAASLAAKSEIDLQQDARLPDFRLVQATTQTDSDAKPGQILDTLNGDAADEVEIIPVSTFKTRAYFGGGKIGDPPTCTSPDALNGYGEEADALKGRGLVGPAGDSGACQSCPQADWRRGGKCQLRHNYVALKAGDDADPMPRGLMMHGTSAKIASRLNTMLLAQPMFWGSTIKLSSKRESNDRGQYYLWQVAKGRPCTDEELVAAFKLFQQVDASRKAGTLAVSGDPAAPAPSAGSGGVDDDVPF